jgi:hypothetical protein
MISGEEIIRSNSPTTYCINKSKRLHAIVIEMPLALRIGNLSSLRLDAKTLLKSVLLIWKSTGLLDVCEEPPNSPEKTLKLLVKVAIVAKTRN